MLTRSGPVALVSAKETGVAAGARVKKESAGRAGHGYDLAMMNGAAVVALLGDIERAGLAVWIGGGWGIDALLGEQTREHRDLDLMHRVEEEPRLLALLADLGYTETVDWRPVRFVMARPDGLEIDLHPLVFKEDGSAEQASLEPGMPFAYPAAAFTTGTIEGTTVRCLSAEQQAHFHQGYEPAERDLHDMARLREAFGIATHF
jgi:lincosamide nucleotidyltransferase A/C/D/E